MDHGLSVRPLTDADAEIIRTWHYPGPYGVYDLPVHGPLPTTDDGYWAIVSEADSSLVGYMRVGEVARPNGMPARDDTVDVNLGLDPARVGQGDGRRLAAVLLEWINENHPGKRVRTAIQSWNIRALRVFRSFGFGQDYDHLCREGPTAVRYTVLQRAVPTKVS